MDEIFAISNSLSKRILGTRVVYFLLVCALSLIGITNMYDVLMVGENRALMVDAAMMLVTLAAILTVVCLAFDIPRELQSGVISVLLSKPLGRTHYLLGKMIGISWVGIFITGLISIGFVIIYSISHGKPDINIIKALVLISLSVIPMGAIVLFFSCIMSESIAATVSTLVIWIGYSLGVTKGITLFDLSLFNMGAEAFYGLEIPTLYLVKAAVSAVLTAVAIVSFTSILFNKRDL